MQWISSSGSLMEAPAIKPDASAFRQATLMRFRSATSAFQSEVANEAYGTSSPPFGMSHVMTLHRASSNAHDLYAAAYTEHYSNRNLPLALDLYCAVLQSDPDAVEAGYARAQIQNIVATTIHPEDLLKTTIDLLHTHFGRSNSRDCIRRIEPSPHADIESPDTRDTLCEP